MKWGNWPELNGFFGIWGFGEEIQRRGAHVNIPELGSRGDV
jgi:hypothetical protein